MPGKKPKSMQSIKTAVKRVLGEWQKGKIGDSALRHDIAQLQEIYNKIRPLHMRRRRGQLSQEETRHLEGFERMARAILRDISAKRNRNH